MDLHEFDNQFRRDRILLIAGIDEAGRGPLAGPVVAAAVILHKDTKIEGVKDSKKTTLRERQGLYQSIIDRALCFAVGSSSPEEIDSLNILQATKLAMKRAYLGLNLKPDLLIIDALRLPGLDAPQEAIIKGDNKSASIAAASIIAKVTRDMMMMELHQQYPQYGFDRHKGYPTKQHRDAIRRHGLSPVHRKTFRVKE